MSHEAGVISSHLFLLSLGQLLVYIYKHLKALEVHMIVFPSTYDGCGF
jgi:hypothetical protein